MDKLKVFNEFNILKVCVLYSLRYNKDNKIYINDKDKIRCTSHQPRLTVASYKKKGVCIRIVALLAFLFGFYF